MNRRPVIAFVVGFVLAATWALAQPVTPGSGPHITATTVNGTSVNAGIMDAGTARIGTAFIGSLDAGNALITGGLAITGSSGLTLGSASNSMNVTCFSSGGVSGSCMFMGGGGNFVGSMFLAGRAQNAGAETALTFGNGASLSSNQALTQWRNGAGTFSGTKVLEVMSTGLVWSANADGGSAGNVTVNQPAGKVAIANGASSMTLTNSLITASTGLHVNLMTNDSTCLGVYATVASGSATIGCTNSTNCGTAAGCNVFFEVRDLR